MIEPTTQPEYARFDMDCTRCEYEPVCILPLKVVNRLTRKWFLSMGRPTICRQGRKKKVIRQSTIAEVIERFEQKKATAAEVPS